MTVVRSTVTPAKPLPDQPAPDRDNQKDKDKIKPPKEKPPKDKDKEKTKIKKPEKKPEKKPVPVEPLPPEEEEIDTAARLNAYGMTGLLFTPTAYIVPTGRGLLNASQFNSKKTEEAGGFNDRTYSLTYGVTQGIEVAVARTTTTFELPDAQKTGAEYGANSQIISFKYQLGEGLAIPYIGSMLTQAKLALGVQFIKQKASYSNAAINESGAANATRFFAIESGKFSGGTGTLGVFYQRGSLFNDIVGNKPEASPSKFAGFGFLAGLEYPMGDALSLIAEYDGKLAPIAALDSISLGVRYKPTELSDISLGLGDISGASGLLLRGAYGF